MGSRQGPAFHIILLLREIEIKGGTAGPKSPIFSPRGLFSRFSRKGTVLGYSFFLSFVARFLLALCPKTRNGLIGGKFQNRI